VIGVDIDRFIGYPSKAVTKVSHGGLMTRSMLRNGNRYNPGPNGAILAPPNVKQRFINTGDKQLSTIMLSWKDNDGVTPPKGILVVDSNITPFTAKRALDPYEQAPVPPRWHQYHDLGDLLPPYVLRRTARVRSRRRGNLGEGGI